MRNPPPTLETERLVLRAYRPDDLESFIQMVNDEKVRRFTESMSLERANGLFESFINGQFPYEVWAVRDCVSQAYLGHVFYSKLDEATEADASGPEIGFTVCPFAWGQGYATEAAKRALRYAFEDGGYTRVYATVDLDNTASIRVLEKLSMTRVRVCVDDEGEYLMYAIDALKP
jgi:RimJ/RimL family protein N-acetyltransferase